MNAALKPDYSRTHAFLGQKHGLLINNEWVEPRAGGRIEVLNPATGKVLGYAAAGGAESDTKGTNDSVSVEAGSTN